MTQDIFPGLSSADGTFSSTDLTSTRRTTRDTTGCVADVNYVSVPPTPLHLLLRGIDRLNSPRATLPDQNEKETTTEFYLSFARRHQRYLYADSVSPVKGRRVSRARGTSDPRVGLSARDRLRPEEGRRQSPRRHQTDRG